MSTFTRIAVQAADVRNGDILIEREHAVIDHLEHDWSEDLEYIVMLVPKGTDHHGWWYHPDAIVTVHRECPWNSPWNTPSALEHQPLGTH